MKRYEFFRVKLSRFSLRNAFRCLRCFALTDDPENHVRWHYVNKDSDPFFDRPANPSRTPYKVTYQARDGSRNNIIVEEIKP